MRYRRKAVCLDPYQFEQLMTELKAIKGAIVSGLTDLQAAIAALQAQWQTFLTDLTNALQNQDSDAAVEAASQLVTQQTQQIAAEDAVVNPPASPPTDQTPGT